MRRRGLNENYARELMELHTLGVDGGYTQKDVQEVARAFTGWTIANPRLGGTYRFEPRLHDDGEKVVLGHRIKAGGGRKDGDEVLDLLARHPSTARFIATKLARRFVADEPPPALVSRAADRFKATDGDIREVVRVIVTSPEFLASQRAKTKNPFEFVVSAVRVTSLDVTNALAARAIAARSRDADLRRAASDRLLGQSRGVGQFRCAAQSHELRGRVHGRPDARASGACHRIAPRPPMTRGGPCSPPRSPTTSAKRRRRRWRKPPRPRRRRH